MNFQALKLRHLLMIAIISISFFQIDAQSFSISGTLIDDNDSIVPAASIMLLNKQDSSFIQGTISDAQGVFTINDVHTGDYELTIQHMLYKRKDMFFKVEKSLNLGDVELDNNDRELGEINVKSVRPVVKMENNTLIYNASAVSEKYIRNNALEVLGDVPGILLKDDEVQLLGAGELSIAINGKPTSMTYDQVLAMLKAMPQENVKEIQVMYAPPAKYNVKGALINIVLNKAERNQYNGSVYAGFRQRRESGFNGGLNLQTSTKKWDVNMMYSGDYDHKITKYQIDIDHLYRDTLYLIRQDMNMPGKSYDHHFQLATDYRVDSLNTISLSYLGNYTKDDDGPRETYATFSSDDDFYREYDTSTSNSTETMHNVKAEYNHNDKLQVGFDYTAYTSPGTDDYVSKVEDQTITYRTKSKQTVHKWMGYMNHSFTLGSVPVNYGVTYQYSGNKNYYSFYNYDGTYIIDDSQSTKNNFSETEMSAFISFEKQFNSHLSFDFSLKGENSQMKKDTLNTHKTLWNTFNLFPSLNVSYIFDEQYNHILQGSLKSYTNYPGYWAISPATYYTNLYMLVKGTPGLKPSQTYESELNYIFKRKYVAMLSYNYTDGMMTQIPYASNETFNTIAQNQNIDFSSDLTAALVIPFQIGEAISINPTFVYLHRRMKNSGSKTESFDRSCNTFVFQYNSSVSLIKKIGLKAELSGFYYGPSIQSIYDIDAIYNVSCGLSCNMFKDKAVINVKMNDIFNSYRPETLIDFDNQNSHYKLDNDTRMLQVTFRYNFGKPFKAKEIDVDQSRFKRLQ